MTEFKTSDRNELSLSQIDDAHLDTVVGGLDISLLHLSPQLTLAATPVGPVMKDVFARYVLGQA
jgi:hypothetical protein